MSNGEQQGAGAAERTNSRNTTDHPAFPQPGDPNVAIWRYLDFPKFEWLLDATRLYMPTADQLGDPLEGSTPPAELEWWKREAANASSDKHRAIIEHNRGFLSRMAQQMREHYFVSCWHMNEHENHGMWKCYTQTRDAVAIKTTYADLRDSLSPSVLMGLVRYIDYAAERLPSMNLCEHIMHKDIYYQFEREVRAVAFPPPVPELGLDRFIEDLLVREASPGSRVYAPSIEPARLIKAVVLHPDATASFTDSIATLCGEHELPKPQPSRRLRTPTF